MSKIPLYTQTSHDWHCNKNQPNKPYAVDLNVGTNEYIFGRVTPNNQFIVSTGLINDPKPYGIQMVGGKKKSKPKSNPKSKSKTKTKKGGNGKITDSFEPTSLSVYNENNYKNNELIYNALDKINKLNGLNSPCKNSMIDAQNNIVGGAKKKITKKRKPKKKSMKGGEENWGATGMPPQYFGSKMPEKVTGPSTVKPNDSAVLNLAPISGGKKTIKKKPVKKTVKKTTTVKKPVKKATTKKTVKKTPTKKPVKKITTKKTPTKKTVKKTPIKKTVKKTTIKK